MGMLSHMSSECVNRYLRNVYEKIQQVIRKCWLMDYAAALCKYYSSVGLAYSLLPVMIHATRSPGDHEPVTTLADDHISRCLTQCSAHHQPQSEAFSKSNKVPVFIKGGVKARE